MRTCSMRDSTGHPPHILGAWGEARAADALVAEGWSVLARNYRFGRKEVDLIVRRGSMIAFVEVKTRTGSRFGGPEAAVTHSKRREIESVAGRFLADLADFVPEVRFDVVAIVVSPTGRVVRVTHIPDAWRPDVR